MKRKKFGSRTLSNNAAIKLVYLYVFDGFPETDFLRKDLNFGGSWNFHLMQSDEGTYIINQLDNPDYVDSFFEDHLNVSCVVGMNGMGKTRLLKFIQFVINEDSIYELSHGVVEKTFSYIAIFQIGKELFYRLSNINDFRILMNDDEVDSTFDELNAKQTSIFYSGYPDLSTEYNFDEPGYLDVSTDFLIHKKYDKKDEENNEKQVTFFNREDIKMQIAFLAHVETEKSKKREFDFIDQFIPESGQVASNGYIQKLDKSARYIDSNSMDVYNEFRGRFFQIQGQLIDALRNGKFDIVEVLDNKRIEKNELTSQLFLLRFYMRLVEQFYYNVEYREHKTSKYLASIVDSTKVNLSSTPLQLFLNFFKAQTLIDKKKTRDLFNYLSMVQQISMSFVWEINSEFFDCDLDNMKALVTIEEKILKLFPYRSKLSLFTFNWRGMSAGQRAMLILFSRLNEAFKVLENHFSDKKHLFFLLDEPEIAYHPQWQQEYLYHVMKYVNWRFSGFSRHLIITSHSPFVLSDIPHYAVIRLGNQPKTVYERKTLGANIYDLLADSFYLPNGFMGVIAEQKIIDLTNYITKENRNFNPETAQKLINLIGEPLIRERLQELYDQHFKGEPTKNQLLIKVKELEAQLRNQNL